jgi:hypothetical protein
VNRAHAAARLAALGYAGASETEFLAALDRLTAARRAFAEAEAVHGPLATPESVAETDHEIRFLEALSGRAPAEFDPDAFPAARWLAALRGGPEAVSPAAAAAARRECATDAAWRREALLRRVDVRAAAAARYPGLCDNDDG